METTAGKAEGTTAAPEGPEPPDQVLIQTLTRPSGLG